MHHRAAIARVPSPGHERPHVSPLSGSSVAGASPRAVRRARGAGLRARRGEGANAVERSGGHPRDTAQHTRPASCLGSVLLARSHGSHAFARASAPREREAPPRTREGPGRTGGREASHPVCQPIGAGPSSLVAPWMTSQVKGATTFGSSAVRVGPVALRPGLSTGLPLSRHRRERRRLASNSQCANRGCPNSSSRA